MGLLDLFNISRPDINKIVAGLADEPGAVLLDVREPDEYRAGHIPGSINLPVKRVAAEAATVLPDKAAPVYVYCLSGARSSRAVEALKAVGFSNVTNVGGIRAYSGKLEIGN